MCYYHFDYFMYNYAINQEKYIVRNIRKINNEKYKNNLNNNN